MKVILMMAFFCRCLSVGVFQIVAWQRTMFIDGVTRSHPVNNPQRQFGMHPLRFVTLPLFWWLVFPAVLPGQIAVPEALTIEHGLSQGMVFDLGWDTVGFGKRGVDN